MPSFRKFAQTELLRPLLLFFTEPLVSLISILGATVFALIYLLSEAIPLVYTSFGLTTEQSMGIMVFVVLGFISSTATRLVDRHIACKRRAQNLPLEPEHKLLGFIIAAPLPAIILWWFAWTIPPLINGIPWIASALSLILLGYATNEFDTVLAGYLADSYTSSAASAITSLALFRALLRAAFPLFTHHMFEGLGANVASSILAAVATLFCAVPYLFVRHGKTLRERSRFARQTLEQQGPLVKDPDPVGSDEEAGGGGSLIRLLERERRRQKQSMMVKRAPSLPTYRTFSPLWVTALICFIEAGKLPLVYQNAMKGEMYLTY